MKILFTGGSSFTGYWFIKELVSNGHEVTATFQKKLEEYEGVRRERVEDLITICTPIYSVSFGSEGFMNLVRSSKWDVFCHHAADTTDYKSADFDYLEAVKRNTHNVIVVLRTLKVQGCSSVVLTGSIFEPNEGVSPDSLVAFSPYGLSKGITWEIFRFYCRTGSINIGKFVIPNPFGPMEDPKFTTYLAKSWLRGEVPQVKTPDYVRDNIHIGLLSKAYAFFVSEVEKNGGEVKLAPGEYRGTQKDFVRLFAREMEQRLGVPCPVEFLSQTDFSEPLVRTNPDELDAKSLGFDEKKAWDSLAEFYLRHYY